MACQLTTAPLAGTQLTRTQRQPGVLHVAGQAVRHGTPNQRRQADGRTQSTEQEAQRDDQDRARQGVTVDARLQGCWQNVRARCGSLFYFFFFHLVITHQVHPNVHRQRPERARAKGQHVCSSNRLVSGLLLTCAPL